MNTVDFFNEISLLYGTITEFCTAQTCPVMSASAQFEYLWCDNQKVKKPIKCSAPEYVDYLMSWVESQRTYTRRGRATRAYACRMSIVIEPAVESLF